MDPAVDQVIFPPLKERAREAFFPVGIDPVIDPVYPGQVILEKVTGSAISPVRKADEDMGEDILPVIGNPWYKILDDPFLVPSPFFAALPALPAVLCHDTNLSRAQVGGHDSPVLPGTGASKRKGAVLFVREMPRTGIWRHVLCGKPAGPEGCLFFPAGKEVPCALIKKGFCLL
jgi:hypothetical protein